MPARCSGNSRQRSRGAQAPSGPPPAPTLCQHCLGPPGTLSAKPPGRGQGPFQALCPWGDSGRAPWAEFRVTLGSSPAEHRPAFAGLVCFQLCPPVSSRRELHLERPPATFLGLGEGGRPPSLTPPVSHASPSLPGEAAQTAPLGGRGQGASGSLLPPSQMTGRSKGSQ